MILLLGAVLVMAWILWWLLSLFLPDSAAVVVAVLAVGTAVVLLARLYWRSERFSRPYERGYSNRFRRVMRMARQAGRYDEIWEVTRRETADEDMALFIEADRQGRLEAFISEWGRALDAGHEEVFFQQRRQHR